MTNEEFKVWETVFLANQSRAYGIKFSTKQADDALAVWREKRASVEATPCGLEEKVDTVGRREAMLKDPAKRIRECGCIVCVCGDDERCHGCGAKMCDLHHPYKIKERLQKYLATVDREHVEKVVTNDE